MRKLRCHLTGAVIALTFMGCDGADQRAKDSTTPAPSTPEMVCGGSVISDSAVGDMRIGQTVSEVSAHCTVVRDTTAIRGEGQAARIIDVASGSDTVEAEVVDDRIWRIGIESPAFRTADSLGVGTQLPSLLALAGVRPLSGEGRVFVMSDVHCGLSFQLSVPDTGTAAGRWSVDDLRRLPEATEVVRVLVIGCAK